MRRSAVWDILTTIFIFLGSLLIINSVWNGVNDLGISDFSTYYHTAKGVFSPRPEHPYVNIVPLYPFFYPPQTLLLFRVFNLAPFAPSKALWAITNGAIVAAFIFLLTKIFNKSYKFSHFEIAFLFLLTTLFFPLQNTIHGGQTNVFLLFLVTAALYLFQQKRDLPAGIILGIATILKISPFLLLIYFLLKRQWKVFVSGLATLGGLTLLTEIFVRRGINWYYFRYVLDDITKQHGSFRDQSLRNFLSNLHPLNKLLRALSTKLPPHWEFVDLKILTSLLSWGVVFILVATLAYLCRKKISDRKSLSTTLEYNLFLTIAVIGTGLVWYHQYAMLLLPLLTSFIILAKSKNYPPLLVVSLAYFLTAIPWESWGLWKRLDYPWAFGMLGGILLNFVVLLLLRLRWIKI